MVITERYSPLFVGVNTARESQSDHMGGFLCQTTGTLTVEVADLAGAFVAILTAFPVTAGVYYPMPFYLSARGARFTTAGGASGLVAV